MSYIKDFTVFQLWAHKWVPRIMCHYPAHVYSRDTDLVEWSLDLSEDRVHGHPVGKRHMEWGKEYIGKAQRQWEIGNNYT